MGLDKFLQEENSPIFRDRRLRALAVANNNQVNLGRDQINPLLQNAASAQFKPSGLYAQAIVRPTSNAGGSIQAALNQVSRLGGGVLYLQAGDYTINQTITVPSNCTIDGQDGDLTLVSFGDGTNNFQVESLAVNVNFKNLSILNCLNGSANIYFNNCTLGGVYNCQFSSGTTAGTSFAILINNSSQLNFENNIALTEGFMRVIDSQIVNISNCSVSSEIGVQGVEGEELGGLQVCNLRNSLFINSKYCLKGVFYASSFVGNYFADASAAGTIIALDDGASENNSFLGNVINGITVSTLPILIDNADFTQIVGNTIVANDNDAIILRNNAQDTVISSNRITGDGGTQFASIRAGTAASDVTDVIISSNILQATNGAGTIVNNAGSAVIVGNLG